MTLDDIEQVMSIEQVAFTAPWSARAYRFEIEENDHSTMLVIRPSPGSGSKLASMASRLGLISPGRVLGYAGCWHLVDEIHISTIAVHPDWRGQGLAELLLLSLLDRGAQLGTHRATLEVRVSNAAARGLYLKYGFEIVSRQKRYYVDNNEDAHIMATPRFDDLQFQENLVRRRREMQRRFASRANPPPSSAP
jgi:ribosomal-protein-alanine N-acetyltransferase